MTFVAFILGLWIGVAAGIFTVALLQANHPCRKT